MGFSLITLRKGNRAMEVIHVYNSFPSDDMENNCYNPKMQRFMEIEEDAVPYRLLCNEYPKAE